MKIRSPLLLTAIALLLGQCVPAFAGNDNTNSFARPANWAVKLHQPGLPNLHQVTTNLYRGAQPTPEGMATLKTMGIKTVVSLRNFHSDTDELSGVTMKAARLHMNPWHVGDDDVIRFLKIASDTNNLPVFVHCQRGADRTGVMCAMYRITVCGWTKAEAIQEMRDGSFNFSPAWKNIIRYIENVDVKKIRERAGMVAKAVNR